MSLKKRLFDQLLQTGRRVLPQPRFAPASLIDTVTNPASYAGLADEATQALGQLLPRQFRGAGFQNVPTSALGALDDLRNIPAGATKDLAQRRAAKEFSKAAGSGTVRVPVIPTGGQPVVPGTVQMLSDDVAKGASTTLKQPGLLNRLNPLRNPGRILNPMSLRGGILYGSLAEPVLSRLGMDEGDKAAVQGALFTPGGPVMKTLAGLVAHDMFTPVADGTKDSPEAKRIKEFYRTQQYDKEQGADLDMGAIRNLPGGSANPLPPFNPNQDLPASAEQSVDTSPFQHQMAIYEQGRNAATTQAERNQVRDLGLAIHKAHNPQLYSNFQTPMASDRTFNPLMANTFPDSYPQTREAFIAEGGVQMPQTMNNVDARNELIEGNRLEGEQMAGQLAASLEAQEFMKKFLSAQTGAK